MLEEIRKITYRGSLRSCNYTCSYCPFGKNQMSLEETERDREDLERFVNRILELEFQKPVSILFAPYGEAMIHKHYREAMIRLSKSPDISGVCCQTNGSFPVEDWLEQVKQEGGIASKLALWVTYHPEMVSIGQFTRQISCMAETIQVSAGAVGNPCSIHEIESLRRLLPPQIYLWINGMDGMKRPYTEEEIRIFRSIDPQFHWELKRGSGEGCQGGNGHFFLDARGDMYPCNRNRQRIGNFYDLQKDRVAFTCRGRLCDCYLAYSHDLSFLNDKFWGGGAHLRIPGRLPVSAVFLDVDGTLTDREGKISSRKQAAIAYISRKIPVFLATDLPEQEAMRVCTSIRQYLSGGCFGGGAYCRDWESGWDWVSPMNLETWKKDRDTWEELVENGKFYEINGDLYRIVIPEKLGRRLESLGIPSEVTLTFHRGQKVSLVSQGVDKSTGVTKICANRGIDVKQVLCAGDHRSDICMLKACGWSVAMPGSSQEVLDQADFCLFADQLAYLI